MPTNLGEGIVKGEVCIRPLPGYQHFSGTSKGVSS